MISQSTQDLLAMVDALSVASERLALVVGPSGSGKSMVLREAASERGWPVVNLSLELSRRMLDMTQRQRAVRVSDEVRSILQVQDSATICVDNVEILFEPSLQVDALHLLQSLAKQHTLVTAWPGRFDGTRLLHAAWGHPEYCEHPADGLALVSLTET